MSVLDLRKEFKHLYAPRAGIIETITVPRLGFATIEGAIEKGRGAGDSPSFAEANEALYSLAFTLKFMMKKRVEDSVDFPVMTLEGLWWVENGIFDPAVKDNWLFRLMIMMPPAVTEADFAEGVEELRKKQGDSEILSRLSLQTFEEGLCVQALHIGPYSAEAETIKAMREFMAKSGLVDRVGPAGKHHEVYLGDPRRTDPAKLKTILRHPVAQA